MDLVKVESSMISAVGYDEATSELEAHFHDGAVWHYRAVPRTVYEELLASSSKGGYMRDFVIDCYRDYRVKRKR
jgi:hypothetical protein